MKRYIAFLLSMVVFLNCFVVSGFFVSGEKLDNTNNTTVNIESGKITSKENTYLDYLSVHSDAESSKKSIIKELDSSTLKDQTIKFDISVEESAFYKVGLSYKTLDDSYSNIVVGLKVDGLYPFSEAKEFEFPRMWCNDGGAYRVDAIGNQFAPQQIEYKEFYYNQPLCDVYESDEDYWIYLTEGDHNIELFPIQGEIAIKYFALVGSESEEKYSAPEDKSLYYNGENIIIEGEDALLKSNYFLIGKSDTSSIDVTPNSPEVNKINYIGGGNWKSIGDTLVWKTPKLSEGYYKIGFSFRQNFSIGSKVYRKLTIDGKVPFAEANSISFGYDDNWQNSFFSDGQEPYLVFLSEGIHEIALSVTAGESAYIRDLLVDAVEEIGSLYIDITMITGDTVDIYRDYELFNQIGDMQERLENIHAILTEAGKRLLKISGEDSGSNYSIIMNMCQVIEQMLENKYEAHRYKDYYYTNYCSVSSVIQSLTEMPLSLDKIVLTSADSKTPVERAGFFERVWFAIKRFFMTFVKDYDAVSSGDGKGITVWVNWGRDQAQVLSSLIDNSFTPKTGINVNLKLSNASIVQAKLSGSGPDCILMHSRSEPVNLAMRGVLYDLSKFDDCDKVLERFQDNAELPYRYKDGLYALPDTQTFFVMFYRKDVLQELGIEVPNTWDEFALAAKTIMRKNMNVWLPNNVATDQAQINAGVGSNNIFPTLLLQKGIPLYAEDGKSTNLLSEKVMETMEEWTNFYRKQKFPVTMDFYTRFRIGTTPLGISPYTFYNTLNAAASEIDGLWGVTSVPGVLNEDGTVTKISAGGGTGCSILKSCEDIDSAWEFLKWWTDYETQLSYSNEIEALLGPSGRVAVANIEAFKALDWENNASEELVVAWENVEEIPEYPGSYYVSRSVYQCFWNVVNANKNPKDMLMKYGKEADDEIKRKWSQYTLR